MMRIIWCKELEDVVNISRSRGWLFYNSVGGKHYYYVYAGVESEIMCLAVKVKERLAGKYVTVDDDGKIKDSDQPIMPSCAKVISVEEDKTFEELLK